jgi:hypothetical protein
VVGVNDLPTSADKEVTIQEDNSHTFSASDFGFTDIDGGVLTSVKITSLPGSGSLTLNGNAVSLNDVIPAGQLNQLLYTPALHGHGNDYTTFTFRVNDGSDNSAVDNTVTVDVTAVNDAPLFTGASILASVTHGDNALNPDGATIDGLFSHLFSDAENEHFSGIAIAGDASIAEQGQWQYTTDNGINWLTVAAVSENSALLLENNSDVKLRFVPSASFNGEPGSLTVYGVDSSSVMSWSSGITRSTFDTQSDSSSSAVSVAGISLSTRVHPDSPPVVDNNQKPPVTIEAPPPQNDVTSPEPSGPEPGIPDPIVSGDGPVLFDGQPVESPGADAAPGAGTPITSANDGLITGLSDGDAGAYSVQNLFAHQHVIDSRYGAELMTGSSPVTDRTVSESLVYRDQDMSGLTLDAGSEELLEPEKQPPSPEGVKTEGDEDEKEVIEEASGEPLNKQASNSGASGFSVQLTIAADEQQKTMKQLSDALKALKLS